MRFRIMIGVAALAALAGCNGTAGGYPEKDRQAVLTSCKGSGAPTQVCECALKKIEATFSYAEFSEWNNALEQGRDHPASSRAKAMTKECIDDYFKNGGK